MKKSLKTLVVTMLSFFILSSCSNVDTSDSHEYKSLDPEKITVYTSFYPMQDFTLKIGGDKLNVTCIVPSGIEPHDWEPSASDIVNLEKADMLIYSGAGLEHWIEDVLSSLTNKELHVVEASKGISLLKGHSHVDEEEYNHTDEHDELHGNMDDHVSDTPEESDTPDPHVWLDPLNVKILAENIQKALSEIDPDNAQYYKENYNSFSAELDNLDQEFKDRLANISSREVIVSHEGFGYLCAAYDLKQLGIEGLSPDSEPTPARMAEIINFAKENQITTIFFEELVSDKVAKIIAAEIKAETAVLSPVESLTDEQTANGDDYFSVMRMNLDALVKALS